MSNDIHPWDLNAFGEKCTKFGNRNRWNSKDEKRMRDIAMDLCAKLDISIESLCFGSNRKEKSCIWREIAKDFPKRTIRSVYRKGMRIIQASCLKTGKFTEEDDIKLVELVSLYGPRWIFIARKMNRVNDPCNERYQRLVSNYRKDVWRKEETELLKRLVQKYSCEEELPWKIISEKFQRRPALCFYHWLKLIGDVRYLFFSGRKSVTKVMRKILEESSQQRMELSALHNALRNHYKEKYHNLKPIIKNLIEGESSPFQVKDNIVFMRQADGEKTLSVLDISIPIDKELVKRLTEEYLENQTRAIEAEIEFQKKKKNLIRTNEEIDVSTNINEIDPAQVSSQSLASGFSIEEVREKGGDNGSPVIGDNGEISDNRILFSSISGVMKSIIKLAPNQCMKREELRNAIKIHYQPKKVKGLKKIMEELIKNEADFKSDGKFVSIVKGSKTNEKANYRKVDSDITTLSGELSTNKNGEGPDSVSIIDCINGVEKGNENRRGIKERSSGAGHLDERRIRMVTEVLQSKAKNKSALVQSLLLNELPADSFYLHNSKEDEQGTKDTNSSAGSCKVVSNENISNLSVSRVMKSILEDSPCQCMKIEDLRNAIKSHYYPKKVLGLKSRMKGLMSIESGFEVVGKIVSIVTRDSNRDTTDDEMPRKESIEDISIDVSKRKEENVNRNAKETLIYGDEQRTNNALAKFHSTSLQELDSGGKLTRRESRKNPNENQRRQVTTTVQPKVNNKLGREQSMLSNQNQKLAQAHESDTFLESKRPKKGGNANAVIEINEVVDNEPISTLSVSRVMKTILGKSPRQRMRRESLRSAIKAYYYPRKVKGLKEKMMKLIEGKDFDIKGKMVFILKNNILATSLNEISDKADIERPRKDSLEKIQCRGLKRKLECIKDHGGDDRKKIAPSNMYKRFIHQDREYKSKN